MSSYPPNIPRCRHIKVNGTQCGSPALHHRKYCYFHTTWHREHVNLYNRNRAHDARASITLPILEDAESVQIALMQVMRLILSGQIDGKTAGLLLYALQTASTNLKRTNFEPMCHEEVVIDPRDVPNTALDENLWEPEQFEEEEEEDNDGGAESQAEASAALAGAPDPEARAAEARAAKTTAIYEKALAPNATINDQLAGITTFMKDTDGEPPDPTAATPDPAQPKPPQSTQRQSPKWTIRNPVMRAAVAFALQIDVEDPSLDNFDLNTLGTDRFKLVDIYLAEYASTH